ncbi:amidohydrolase family protein [Aquimarina sp. U1-2]|uniref:amidohydrolase family protein n=1 Tax=Aquimarina sp. U1-2 TaxID=2823141 RepID=UPI001AECE9F0|nr:amidohydrolase family protein [Aquimarina sp. U1-2]MBP2830873.1 amidohydrolase family protein [Aquimarina sp. U1-2]
MKIVKKILIVALILILIAVAVLFFGIRYETKLQSGGFTKVINPEPFFERYERIGIEKINVLIHDDSLYFITKNVVLESGRITAIDTIAVKKEGVHYIDGYGKYLVPGLADTHVHLENSKNDLYLYLANGVTSVYEMYGNQNHLRWKEEAIQGAISPHIKVASSKITSLSGMGPKIDQFFGGAISFSTKDAVRDGVENLKKQGYDALKLSSLMDLKIYEAINKEANTLHMPVLGHVSKEVGLENLYNSNQTQVAHVEEILKNVMSDFGSINEENSGEFLRFLTTESESIAKKLKSKDISVSTTIWLMETLPKQVLHLSEFIATIELSYVNPGVLEGSNLRKGWLPGNNGYELPNPSEADKKWRALFWKTYVEGIHIITKSLFANEVKVLVGTDANVSGVVPGFSIHDELASLSKLNIANEKILKAATSEASNFMNLNSGVILEGNHADLLILSNNPLENINNLKAIERIFIGNATIDKENIEKLLSEIAKTNNENRSVNITEFTKE